ncbi:hypothetical protein CCH79_00020997, partial [Gambusia affinis]
MASLSQVEPKSVTILIFSEQVRMEDMRTWLGQRCTVIKGLELKDEDGIRTGGRRFYVQLRRDMKTGEIHHLPPVIQLGAIRGHPKACRKCNSQQHLSAECQNTHCKNCKANDHLTKDCPHPLICNLCGEGGHTFRTCPRSYANRAKYASLQSEGLVPRPEPENDQEQEEVGNRDRMEGDPPPPRCPRLPALNRRTPKTTPICPRPGCGAPESVRHLLWKCSAAVDLWAKAGSFKFPHLPAREVLHAQLVLYGRHQISSTDSSGGPEIESWPEVAQNPTPFIEEHSIAEFSDISQMASEGRAVQQTESWKTQRKKSKKK